NGCISCLVNIDLHLALKLNAYGSSPSLLPNGDLLIIRDLNCPTINLIDSLRPVKQVSRSYYFKK
ncbi:MAG: hypothetical protein ACTSR2_09550, partial [Candidatus Hodarchaeales archaeon]